MTSFQCSYYERHICRSCHYLELSYEEGLNTKLKILQELFPQIPLSEFVPSPEVFPSRNKAKIAVTGTVQRPILGIVDKNYKGKELLSCSLHQHDINALLAELKSVIKSAQLTPYDIVKRQGELKFLIIQQDPKSREALLRFVLRSQKLREKIAQLLPSLQKKFPFLKVISLNIQEIPQAILEGPEEIILTEERTLTHQMGPYQLLAAPKSFFQTNSSVAEKLYQTVGEVVKNIRPQMVLDLYCGVGAFSFFASPWCPKVIGVEISSEAIECARVAKEKNQIPHVEFYSADVGVFLKEIFMGPSAAAKKMTRPDVIIVNPPRAGLLGETISYLRELLPQYLIYSSCHPSTLKRDSEKLADLYHIQSLRPFDMFPLTPHMEVLAILQRRKN